MRRWFVFSRQNLAASRLPVLAGMESGLCHGFRCPAAPVHNTDTVPNTPDDSTADQKQRMKHRRRSEDDKYNSKCAATARRQKTLLQYKQRRQQPSPAEVSWRLRGGRYVAAGFVFPFCWGVEGFGFGFRPTPSSDSNSSAERERERLIDYMRRYWMMAILCTVRSRSPSVPTSIGLRNSPCPRLAYPRFESHKKRQRRDRKDRLKKESLPPFPTLVLLLHSVFPLRVSSHPIRVLAGFFPPKWRWRACTGVRFHNCRGLLAPAGQTSAVRSLGGVPVAIVFGVSVGLAVLVLAVAEAPMHKCMVVDLLEGRRRKRWCGWRGRSGRTDPAVGFFFFSFWLFIARMRPS